MKKTLMFVMIAVTFLALGLTPQTGLAVGSISGTVSNADGPVVGAMVMVQGLDMRRGQRPFMAHGESGENGAFSFADVPAGRYVVAAMTRDLGGARAQAEVADGQNTEVNLELVGGGRGGHGGGRGGGEERPMGSLVGAVVDANGDGIGPARVVLMPARLQGRGMRVRPITLNTADDGTFSVEALPAGNWIATAGIRGVGMGRARVAVEAGAEANVEITIRARE